MSTTSIRDRRTAQTADDAAGPFDPDDGARRPRSARAALVTGLAVVALLGAGTALQQAAGSSDPSTDRPQPVAPVEQQRWGGQDVYEPGGRTAPEPRTGRWGGPDVHEPRLASQD